MALMRFDPFRDVDRFTEQVLGAARMPRTMPMEAFRRGDEFYIYLDMPGVTTEDIDLTVERNVVTIRAERRSPRQEGDEVIVDERPQGMFVRQLFLGDNMDLGKLAAEYSRGVLNLVIPVSEASKPRKIELSSEAAEPQRISSGDRDTQTESSSSESTQDTPEPARAGT